MTKKHYEAIAKIMKDHHVTMQFAGEHAGASFAIRALADYFEADNPKFNRDKFLTACGIEQHWLNKYSKTEQERYLKTVRKLSKKS